MDAPVDRVSPWTVPALECDASVLGDVLDALGSEDAGIVSGDTVGYWQTVVSLAGEFVRGGRVVPHLALREDSGVAVWRALPSTAEDFNRLQSLRKSMPPLARALVTDDVATRAEKTNSWGDADVRSARDVLVRMLDVCVDAAVRDRLTSDEPDGSGGELDDVHEQWLAALTRPDGTIDADPDALEDLRQQLDEWTRSLETTGEQGVRLCLRLWAPEPEPESHPDADAEDTQVSTGDVAAVSPNGWELELLLQAADDPSLLVEASTVWKSTEATTEVLERHLDRPQETLLEELGRAASLYPTLESALDEATPTTLELTATEANEFLREKAEVLEQAGFGLDLATLPYAR